MDYFELPPPPPLDRVVHCFWFLRAGPEAQGAIQTIVPDLLAWATSLLEFAGGAALMAGALVLPLSGPLAIVMLTAMFSVHLRYGPIGCELNLPYLAGLATLALGGPGRLSLDHWFKTIEPRRNDGRR